MRKKLTVLFGIWLILGCVSSVYGNCEDDPFTETDEKWVCNNTYTNSIGIDFVLIPAGSFKMGSDAQPDEQPIHQVSISKSFLMAKTEVTQAQWQKVMGNNPSVFNSEKLKADSKNHPVESVSWNEVQQFIKKLNEIEGGNYYRLPTEAEWEYATRGGTGTAWLCRGSAMCLDNFSWFSWNSRETPHTVATKYPNKWGLHDTIGNVWEWIADWYDEKYYSNSPSDDPQGPKFGKARVIRGGGWINDPQYQRATNRDAFLPNERHRNLGFRLARDR